MSKQDRQGVRTPAEVEQKYNFGKTFAEVFNLITDAQKAAEEAQKAVDSLDHEQIFNLLTDNGRIQGVYRGDDGDVYINASYIKSGKIAAEFIDADNLTITDGAFVGGTINVNDNFVVDEDGNLDIDGSINFKSGYVGFATGMHNGVRTPGVAMAEAETLKDGMIAYESIGRYVIVTSNGVRLQAGYNNVTLTDWGIYLAIKNEGDAVIHRLCVEPDGLWWEYGDTRHKIADDSGLNITETFVPVWG